jgi:DNA-binding transcriptional LysR family regulator
LEGKVDWNDLKIFLAVAHGKTLSAAAAQLDVSPSTVSRRIEGLERALDVQLFRPHRDGYDLTTAGRDLVPLAERTGAQMRVFERNARGRDNDHAGSVCIEAPELLGQGVILPHLASFMERHPTIRIELRSSVRSMRLVGETADIVLRLVRPEQGAYKLRKLGQIRFGLYASSEYVEQHGIPTGPDDLHRHRVIGWSEELRYLTMARWLDTTCPGLQPSLRLTSLGAQLAAARRGFGWAVLPVFAARPVDLVPCLFGAPELNPDLWLLVHEQSATLPRVAIVRDHLIQAIASGIGAQNWV